MFQALAAEEDITIVLVTHDAGVAGYAKRTIRIRDGLIEAGAFSDPGRSRAVGPMASDPVQMVAPH